MITINVLPEEELLSVIDKIVTSQQPDIRLIIPNGARILESVENFSLIKREAEGAGKVVSVATADPTSWLRPTRNQSQAPDHVRCLCRLSQDPRTEEIRRAVSSVNSLLSRSRRPRPTSSCAGC